MASTVLPNGIIVPEKFSRDWYADLYHNWQELDNLLGTSPGDGTLTIQKNGTTVGTFSANQETNETVNIEVPTATSELTNDSGFITGVSWNDVSDKPPFAAVATSGSYDDLSDKPTIPTVNNATLTIQQNSVTVDTFTANSSSDKTVNIQCVDLSNNQTVGGDKDFTGTTGTHDVIPATTDTYDLGSSAKEYNNAYAKTVVTGGITLDNKAIGTNANGNMTFDSHIVDTIEEQGEGYIRYSNGIQICWGKLSITCDGAEWGSLYEGSQNIFKNYPKSFMAPPAVTMGSIGGSYCIIEAADGTAVRTPLICAVRPVNFINTSFTFGYFAIGNWK